MCGLSYPTLPRNMVKFLSQSHKWIQTFGGSEKGTSEQCNSICLAFCAFSLGFWWVGISIGLTQEKIIFIERFLGEGRYKNISLHSKVVFETLRTMTILFRNINLAGDVFRFLLRNGDSFASAIFKSETLMTNGKTPRSVYSVMYTLNFRHFTNSCKEPQKTIVTFFGTLCCIRTPVSCRIHKIQQKPRSHPTTDYC